MSKVSVIIPLYNKQNSIGYTIDSVLAQDFKDFELLIINDGSTDNSLEVINKYTDSRIHIINKKNEGVSMTRNRGVQEASSDLIFFLDADDKIYPDCLSVLMRLYEDYPNADLWSANYEKGYNHAQSTVLADLPRGYVQNMSKMLWLRKWNFRTGSFMCTKSSFIKSGGFPTEMTVGEDYYWMDKYCSLFKCAYDSSCVIMTYVFETRGLSGGGKPLHSYIEWHLDFTDKWGYRKLRYGELLGISLIGYLLHFNIKDFWKLFKKQHNYALFSLYSLYRRSIRNYTQKHEKPYNKNGVEEY